MNEEVARQIGELVAGQKALHSDVSELKCELRSQRKDLQEVSRMATEHRNGIRLMCAIGAAGVAFLSAVKGWWPFHK